MATATASKPKTERTIVSSRLTAGGVKVSVAASAIAQLERAKDLCQVLGHSSPFAAEAISAFNAIHTLLEKTQAPTDTGS